MRRIDRQADRVVAALAVLKREREALERLMAGRL